MKQFTKKNKKPVIETQRLAVQHCLAQIIQPQLIQQGPLDLDTE